MARIMVSSDDDPEIYYLNENPVGPGCPNRRDDVLLVQFFLRVFADRDRRFRPASGKDLLVSGQYSDLVADYLKQYVAESNRNQPNGNQVKFDGRVDSPIGSGSIFTPGAGTYWVMIKMNLDYQNWFPKTGLPHSPVFPKELRKNFYVA